LKGNCSYPVFLISLFCFLSFSGLDASSGGRLIWKFTSADSPLRQDNGAHLSAAGDLEYSFPLDGAIEYSSPGIAPDGTIYFGTYGGYVYALAPDSTLKWRFRTGGWVFKPAVIDSDGTIYIGSDDHFVYALNPDGTLKWRYQAGAWINSPAIGVDGTLYAGTGDGILYALDRQGKLKWRYFARNYISQAAVGGDGTVYFGIFLLEQAPGGLYALNPDGRLKWLYDTPGACTIPAIDSDGTVYFCSRDGYCYALNSDGSLKWRFTAGDRVFSCPVIGLGGTIYFGAEDRYFYALNADGSLKWRYETEGSIWCGGTVGSDGTVYFGSLDANFYALDPQGTLKWTFRTGSNVICPPAIDKNGIVYFGSMDNNLYALDTGTGAGLADSPWPKYARDMVNSARSSSETEPRLGTLSVDSVTTAFDSSFSVSVHYQSFQEMSAIEFSLSFDKDAIRLDSVSLAGSTRGMSFLELDISGADTSGVLDVAMLDLTLASPVPSGTGILVEVHFTETGNIEQVVELGLSSCSGSSTTGSHIYLTGLGGKVVIMKLLKSCDINRDGKVNIADVISFLLGRRAEPDNPSWDWNADGINSIADIYALLLDIRKGRCPDAVSLLASSAGASSIGKIEGLTKADIEYLEQIAPQLGLTPDEEAAFSLALYGDAGSQSLPKTFSLARNSPNPFNPSTAISYSVPEGKKARVTLKIFDLRGRLVCTLVDDEKEAGSYTAFWDGTDQAGRHVSSGVYLCRMQAGDFSKVRKMVLLK